LNREERTNLTKHIVYEIYDECIKWGEVHVWTCFWI
jgi:hypothetical protein